jgi:hypothetical protein
VLPRIVKNDAKVQKCWILSLLWGRIVGNVPGGERLGLTKVVEFWFWDVRFGRSFHDGGCGLRAAFLRAPKGSSWQLI